MITTLHGDCRDQLQTLPAGSVQVIVTSPPYYGLRKYSDDPREIGQEAAPDCMAWARREPPCGACYVCALRAVFAQAWRVLRDDGVAFLNLGDSYAGSSQTGGTSSKEGSAKRMGRMFKSDRADARRAGAYDTSDKGQLGYQDRGCLCGNLCDVCRVAYRSRTTRSDGLLVAMLVASLSESSLEHTAAPIGHLPTLDSVRPAAHTERATQDREHSPDHATARLLVALESMLGESFQQHLGVCLQRASHGECLLCARSLVGYAQASVDMQVSPSEHRTNEHATQDQPPYMNGSAQTGDALDSRTGGMVSGFCSYPHYTTVSHHTPPDKNLLGIPWRVAFALQADGWYLRSDVIWNKPNCMPESVTDRPTRAHEYVFLLTKSARYFYDAAAIAESVTGHDPGTRGASLDHKLPPETNNGRNGSTLKDANRTTRNKRTVWTIATQPYSGAHYATMPEALIAPCILAGSSAQACETCGAAWGRIHEATGADNESNEVGKGSDVPGLKKNSSADRVRRLSGATYQHVTRGTDRFAPRCACAVNTGSARSVVLDPFGGSGTVGRVATRYQRDAVLIELNQAYIDDHIETRTDGVQVELFV